MPKIKTISYSRSCLLAQKERLEEVNSWYPYPCLLSIGILLLVFGHILPGINPRLGNPAQILDFAAEKAEEGPVWLSLSVQGQQVVVTTDDRKVFRWPAQSPSAVALEPFVAHLQGRIVAITLSAALKKAVSLAETLVVIAVDQNLQYTHFVPVLQALVKAGISEYAFETKRPLEGSVP